MQQHTVRELRDLAAVLVEVPPWGAKGAAPHGEVVLKRNDACGALGNVFAGVRGEGLRFIRGCVEVDVP